MYKGGGSMRPYHQNLTVCIKSFYWIPLDFYGRFQNIFCCLILPSVVFAFHYYIIFGTT